MLLWFVAHETDRGHRLRFNILLLLVDDTVPRVADTHGGAFLRRTGFSLPFGVGDWVAVDEALHGETIVGDGQGSTAYLIGVSETLEIVAVTLSSDGLPTSYATVQGSGATGPFNAGWAIYDEEEEATRIVFAGQDGVYELPAFSTTDPQ